MNKIPFTPHQNNLGLGAGFTKEGFDNLKKEQAELLIERKDAVDHLQKARAMGHLSENGYYRSSIFQLKNETETGFKNR